MAKYKILYVASEINPFLQTSEVADFVRNLPQAMQEKGMEIRILVPRFGLINERKNRLHEVVRLSGINIEVGDDEKPLIIKVASIPQAKLQVYFIDNEEYFPSKQMLHDLDGNFMSNNDERMIFYCKGVIETVRKLGWSPDIIHCQGWFSSLVPMYIRKVFSEDPLFDNVKIVYSVFDTTFSGELSSTITEKLLFEKLTEEDVNRLQKPNINNLHKFAIDYADAIVEASPNIEKDVLSHIKSTNKPFMQYPGEEDYIDAYQDFYEQFIGEEEIEEVVLTED